MKSEKELYRIGKFLSLVLRHKPEEANLTLDKNGWVDTKTLLKNLDISIEDLDWIVENNNKKRFTYNDSKTKIRANQGHSLEVDVELELCTEVPQFLYHGTSTETVDLILKDGIVKMSRNHVHLSIDTKTAVNVGKRKDKNISIIGIDSKQMFLDGEKIWISKNGVYLVERVPSKYIIHVGFDEEDFEIPGTKGEIVDLFNENLTQEEWNALCIVHKMRLRLNLGIRFDWDKSIDVRSTTTSQIVDETVFLNKLK